MREKLFNIAELDPGDPREDTPVARAGIQVEKFMQIHEERVESIKQLVGRIPGPGEIFFLWTINSFNAFTFIPFVIKELGRIDELIISTYSINIRIIESLMRYVDKGKISTVRIFISDSLRSRLPKVNDHLQALVEKRPGIISVTYAWNHSKIALIRSGDHYFDVEGSGNWGENAQHEQYIFLNDHKIYEFRKQEIALAADPRAAEGG